ncbi:MAG: tyrosine-type recombinase/integrase [Dehalococcoidia bacterium]
MIRKRGKNSWQVIIELPADPTTGRRRQQSFTVRGSKRDATAAETAAQYKRDTGVAVDPTKMTVGAYLDHWLVAYAQDNVSAKTLAGYRQIAGAWKASLGGVELRKLQPSQIQAALSEMRSTGLAQRTVLHRFRVLKLALGHARDWRMVGVNQADSVKPPRPETPEMRTLSPVEAASLVDALDGQWAQVVGFTLETGMRLGEVLGLKWSDVSFEPAYVQVQRSLGYLPKRGRYFKEPKTPKARRRIALSAATTAMLRERRKGQIELRSDLGAEWNSLDLVFPTPMGDPQQVNNASSTFGRLAKAAGFPGLRFHDLRHTSASLLLAAGTNVKVVSERLGHATPAFTLSVYAHTLPSMHDQAAETMEAVFEAGRQQRAAESVDNPLSIARLVSN